MIRLCPKHKGSSNVLSQLHARLAKLKREAIARAKQRRGRKTEGVQKEGEAQVCMLGKTMSGKSWLMRKLTEAKPELAAHSFTTTRPVVGMMTWRGVKIQLVEIPATFDAPYMSVCRTADAIALIVKDEEDEDDMLVVMKNFYIRRPHVTVNPWTEDPDSIREKLAHTLRLIIVHTKSPRGLSSMSLPVGSNVSKFAERIHKDFIKHFRFAFLWRMVNGQKRRMQVGLSYVLQDGDIVELHM